MPFAAATLHALERHHWAGNARELRNAVETALAMGHVDLSTPPAPASSRASAPVAAYRDARAEAIAAFEQSYLGSLIERCGGNASEAARQARMDRPYLLALLKKHGLR